MVGLKLFQVIELKFILFVQDCRFVISITRQTSVDLRLSVFACVVPCVS